MSEASEVAGLLRSQARRWSDLAWALDSAMSLRRKAEPYTGYRSAEALGDVPWSPVEYDRRVADALFKGLRALRTAGLLKEGV